MLLLFGWLDWDFVSIALLLLVPPFVAFVVANIWAHVHEWQSCCQGAHVDNSLVWQRCLIFGYVTAQPLLLLLLLSCLAKMAMRRIPNGARHRGEASKLHAHMLHMLHQNAAAAQQKEKPLLRLQLLLLLLHAVTIDVLAVNIFAKPPNFY